MWRKQDVGAPSCKLPELLHLFLRQAGLVGKPDGAVLERVYR